jgi:hypothetical protein
MHRLTKLSSPGFTLETDHLHIILRHLDAGVCGLCRKGERGFSEPFPANFDELSERQRIDILMGTSCGCEYMVELDVQGPSEAQQREAFEALVRKELGDIAVMDGGRYISQKISNYWRCWQEGQAFAKNFDDFPWSEDEANTAWAELQAEIDLLPAGSAVVPVDSPQSPDGESKSE